jgi:hypothetical protein
MAGEFTFARSNSHGHHQYAVAAKTRKSPRGTNRFSMNRSFRIAQEGFSYKGELAGMSRAEFLIPLGRDGVFPFETELRELEATGS